MDTILSVTTIEGRKDYDLYISSEYRQNAFVNLGPSFDVANCSPFELLYKNNQDTYESLINKFKNMQEPNQLLFLGISNSAAVFLLNGLKLLNHINKELKNHTNNATINRIILTDKLDKKSPLKICPTPTSGSFVLSPNYNPPASKTKYNNHIAVYYTKEPEKFYYPIE
tara:strand:+ start:5315 stop:5821 length:507 start_codon:yes stop_codon:yes gene_type:complete